MKPYIRDELILSVAGILGFGEWFYPMYVSFLESAATGMALLGDFVSQADSSRIPKELLNELLLRLPQRNRGFYSALAVELLQSAEIVISGTDVSAILSQAVLDPRLLKLERFLFLVAATIVWRACNSTVS
jgi:hypothetical protein